MHRSINGMKQLLFLFFICITAELSAQEITDTSFQHTELNEVVISANKFAERRKNIVQQITVVNARQIRFANTQNTGDLLMNSGNVFVQKSQQGGSSPVIRGFEASRILLVIDGVRLNNAIFRAGHLQNVITVDQNILERVEVLYGPASTIYGSDALGGVIHLKTKMPSFSNSKTSYSATAFARYSSANNEKTVHADIGIGGKKIASLTSFTYSDFDDMKMGDNYRDKYPDFGRRNYYVQRFGDIDSIVSNNDDRVQKYSGYSQFDLLQKFTYKASEKVTHSLNLQKSSSSNIPRYDRLTDIRNGSLRYAEWYYGPQERNLIAYELNAAKLPSFFQEIRVAANYQYLEESRHQRNYRNDNRDNRIEKIGVIAASVDARRKWPAHEWNVGADMQLNDLNSSAYRLNIVSNERAKLDSRYPDGKNKMNYFGIYTQHLWKIIPEKLVLNDGVRFQYVNLHSTISDRATQLNLPFSEIKQDNVAITGNLGLVYLPATHTKLSLGLATGFRAPNIDDLARIFESNTQSRQLIVPNPNLKPEYTYSVDMGMEIQISQGNILRINAFHTWFENAIGLAPFKYQEKDSMLYNGVMSAVLANQNYNKARMYGASATINSRICEYLSVDGAITYTYGRLHTSTGPTPMDHIPPVYGRVGTTISKARFQTEFYMLFNGWKRIGNYNLNGEDNLQYATPEGMPSWYTLNLKSQFQFSRHLMLQVGLENILDRNYRTFASGFSAAGRNFIIAIRAGI